MKKLINDKSFKKSFRIVIFFILFISLTFGGFTLCKLVFDTSDGKFWDGTVATSFASGSGTSTDPYIVSTPEEFAYIQEACIDEVYIELSDDIYFRPSSTYIDYDLSTNTYTYINGETTVPFDPSDGLYISKEEAIYAYPTTTDKTSCHINGNGHKVYGLYIDGFDEGDTNTAFLYTFTGSISNLFFQNTMIYGTSTSFINNIYDSSINNLYFDGYIDNDDSNSGPSAFINTSANSTYDTIKIEGYINSNSKAAGFMLYSQSNTITNFQFNQNINTRNGNGIDVFIHEAYGEPTEVMYGYYNGNLILDSNSYAGINEDSYINYTDVYAMGTCTSKFGNYTSGTGIVYQSIDSNIDNYLEESSIIDAMNKSFEGEERWITKENRAPELNLSLNTSITPATLTIEDSYSSYDYTSTNNNLNTYQMPNGFNFKVTNIDASSLKEIGYYISSTKLDDPSTVTYTDMQNDNSVNEITASGNYIIYIKITDLNNNVTYINSDIFTVGGSNYYIRTTTGDSTNTITKKTILKDNYTLIGTENISGTRRLNVSSIPADTKIVLVDDNIAYTYTATGTESYINLTSFKVMGSTSDIYHQGNGANSINFYYDFSNASEGTFNVSLEHYSINTVDVYTSGERTDVTIEDSESSSIGTSSFTVDSSDTINLNTIGSYDISYILSIINKKAKHYMTFTIKDSNHETVAGSMIDGISITYDDTNYYPNDNGEIIVPIGYILENDTSNEYRNFNFDVTVNVEHLTNVNVPGNYYFDANIDGTYHLEYSTNITYMTNKILKDRMVVDYTNKVLYRDTNRTLTFTIYNDTETSLYQNETISAAVSLYKKETLGSSSYSLIDIANYTSSVNEVVSSTDKSYMLNDDLDKYNSNPASIVFNNSITTGAYQLKIDYYIENTYVSSDYIYFIVK